MQLSFHIKQLRVMALVGILPQERRLRQPLLISCSGVIEPKRWPVVDLDDSVSYADIADCLRDITLAQHWDLLEELLETQRAALVQRFPLINSFEIELAKPEIIPDAAAVGLSLSWSKSQAIPHG